VGAFCFQQFALAAVPQSPFVLSSFTFSGDLVTLYDVLRSDQTTDLTGTVDWGDGTTSAGVLRSVSSDGIQAIAFSMSGTHTYVSPGSWSVSATVLDPVTGQSLTNSVMITSGIQQFTFPTASPWGIIAGPDGNLWATDYGFNAIDRITSAGALTQFDIPTLMSLPTGIAVGADGNLWFTEWQASQIGRISTAGAFTEFPTPTPSAFPTGIAAGPDGNLWACESAGAIARVTLDGELSEFALPDSTSVPTAIATGPDGNLWFTEVGGNRIGRITPDGNITEFSSSISGPNAIAAGSDGALWFTGADGLGRITTSGVVSQWSLTTPVSAIALGPDGAMWLNGQFGLVRVTADGSATYVALPSSGGTICAGPDGKVWLTRSGIVDSFAP
jgi:virginiamycin B lyase